MINSMTRSLITAKKYYRSMLAGNEAFNPGSFDLVSSSILTGSQTSITFDTTGLGSTYKHLQIRFAARGNRSDVSEPLYMRLNADTANYSWHSLYGQGSSVTSNAGSSQSYMQVAEISSASASANIFAGGVVDLLDPFSTSKNKTIRGLSGIGNSFVGLLSGGWYSTSAVTSITLYPWSLTTFTANSRFSIYGIKG